MAHCLFEQSGTFKNEFIKLGIPAADYDIQNNFGETDHVVDLFEEIEKAYTGGGYFYIRQNKKGRFDNCVFSVHSFLFSYGTGTTRRFLRRIPQTMQRFWDRNLF